MSSKGLKNYGWWNVREMEKKLSSGNSSTRKHGLKMVSPVGTDGQEQVPALQVPPSMKTQTKEKGQCPVSFVP